MIVSETKSGFITKIPTKWALFTTETMPVITKLAEPK